MIETDQSYSFKMPRLWWLLTILMVTVLLAFAYITFDRPVPSEALAMNTPYLATAVPMATEFQLPDRHGELVSLSDFSGRPVMLNFWATWCAPCRREMPLLDQTYHTYAAEELVILGINVAGSTKQVTDYIAENELTFPILLDRDARVTDLYRAHLLPVTIFIAPDGAILKVHLGELRAEQLDIYLTDLFGFPSYGVE